MIKKFLLGGLITLLLLVGTLAVHIYLVTKPKTGGIPMMVMSRIDFPYALDSLEGITILHHLSQMDGISDARVNISAGFMVCLYDRNLQSPHDLVEEVNTSFSTKAVLYQPSEEMLSQSCPAMDKSSLTYRLGAFFQKTFEN